MDEFRESRNLDIVRKLNRVIKVYFEKGIVVQPKKRKEILLIMKIKNIINTFWRIAPHHHLCLVTYSVHIKLKMQ